MSGTPDPKPESPQEQGISLDELAKAYAQSMGRGAAPDPAPPEGPGETTPVESVGQSQEEPPEATAEPPSALSAEDPDQEDPCPLCPRTILEAMLFVGNREDQPLTSARAAELMRGVSPDEIPALVDELNRRYAPSGCPYRIIGEGAGYRISLHKKFHPVRNKFYGRIREARLSQAALDVLAIVAYRQPIVGEEVSRLRGTPSGHILTQLVRRQLLWIERAPGKRRPVSYRTTDRFLALFGLESLEDLPESEELQKR